MHALQFMWYGYSNSLVIIFFKVHVNIINNSSWASDISIENSNKLPLLDHKHLNTYFEHGIDGIDYTWWTDSVWFRDLIILDSHVCTRNDTSNWVEVLGGHCYRFNFLTSQSTAHDEVWNAILAKFIYGININNSAHLLVVCTSCLHQRLSFTPTPPSSHERKPAVFSYIHTVTHLSTGHLKCYQTVTFLNWFYTI